MINKKMHELGSKRSVIRELFEYGKKRKLEIGEKNVFDFSLGNPSVPSPDVVNAATPTVVVINCWVICGNVSVGFNTFAL